MGGRSYSDRRYSDKRIIYHQISHIPLLPFLTNSLPKYSHGVWGSAVSYRSGVWGGALTEVEFGAFQLQTIISGGNSVNDFVNTKE